MFRFVNFALGAMLPASKYAKIQLFDASPLLAGVVGFEPTGDVSPPTVFETAPLNLSGKLPNGPVRGLRFNRGTVAAEPVEPAEPSAAEPVEPAAARGGSEPNAAAGPVEPAGRR